MLPIDTSGGRVVVRSNRITPTAFKGLHINGFPLNASLF